MKKITCLLLVVAIIYSCNKQGSTTNPVTEDISAKILKLGFNPSGAYSYNNGFIVEGDIYLSKEQLSIPEDTSVTILIAETEQYRTTNLVTGINRNITVSIAGLPALYTNALVTAIARYNAEELTLHFTFVGAGANISITSGTGPYLGQSGFPSGGNPFNSILLNPTIIGAGATQNYVASIIAHELGHCIGFRHTDWFNRAFSHCTVDASHPANEGAGSSGAIQIPGTPATEDAGSWMLACINPNTDVPFNANDRIALMALYPRYKVTQTTCVDAFRNVSFQGAVGDVMELTVACGGYLNWNSAYNGAGVSIDVGANHFQSQHITSTSGNSVSLQGTTTMNITIPSSGVSTWNMYSYMWNPGSTRAVSGSIRVSKLNGVARSFSPQPSLCLQVAPGTW